MAELRAEQVDFPFLKRCDAIATVEFSITLYDEYQFIFLMKMIGRLKIRLIKFSYYKTSILMKHN